MLRAKGNGDRQVVVDGGGGRSAAPLLSPPPLQEQGSLPSQDAHTAGGALNPPPLPGGALEALPPSQLVDARSPPPSGRFMPLHELPGLSLSTPPFPAPRAPIPPSTPPPTFCFAGDGLRMSRQWCWCPTIVSGEDADMEELGRGCWCSPLSAGFSDSSGGERGRSAPTVLARPGRVLAADVGVTAAAAPASAATAFEGDVDFALPMARACSRACAWVPPFRPQVGEDCHGRTDEAGAIGAVPAACPRFCTAAAFSVVADASGVWGLRGIGETRFAGGGCCSSESSGSNSLFHLPLPLFMFMFIFIPPSLLPPPLPPPPMLSSDMGEKAPSRRRTQGATSGDAAGLVSTVDASAVMPLVLGSWVCDEEGVVPSLL